MNTSGILKIHGYCRLLNISLDDINSREINMLDINNSPWIVFMSHPCPNRCSSALFMTRSVFAVWWFIGGLCNWFRKVGVTVDAGRCTSSIDECGKDTGEEHSSCLEDRKVWSVSSSSLCGWRTVALWSVDGENSCNNKKMKIN